MKQNASYHEALAGGRDTEEWRSSKTSTVHKSNLVRSAGFQISPEITQRLCRVIWELEGRINTRLLDGFQAVEKWKWGEQRQPEALILPFLCCFPMWTGSGSLLEECVTCPVELLLLGFPRSSMGIFKDKYVLYLYIYINWLQFSQPGCLGSGGSPAMLLGKWRTTWASGEGTWDLKMRIPLPSSRCNL